MVLTVYKLDPSPPARAVMMLIDLLKIPDVNYVDVDLFEEEHYKEAFLKINPQHTIPTITDGDFSIWDSHAIASYLVATYGKNDSLYPKDPKKRAIIDQRLHFDTGILFPSIRGTMFPVLFLKEPKFRAENLAKLEPAYEFCESFLTNTWIAGDELTIADICCVATVSSMACLVPIDKKKFPKLTAWLDRCGKLDFYIKVNAPGLKMFAGLIKKEYY